MRGNIDIENVSKNYYSDENLISGAFDRRSMVMKNYTKFFDDKSEYGVYNPNQEKFITKRILVIQMK